MPLTSKTFTGLNLYADQGDLKPGELTIADNVSLSAGELETRPGFQAQLSAALGQPFYGPLAYLKGDGSTTVLLSGNGNLYSWVKYANTVSEVLNAVGGSPFSITSAGFQGCRLGTYAYFVDGSNNPPIRTNLASNTAEYVSGLNPPSSAPVASLSSQVVDPITTISGWQQDAIAAQINVMPNNGQLTEFNTSTEYRNGAQNIGISDLVIVDGSAKTVSSADFPFTQSSVGCTLHISSGSGFTTGDFTINSVDNSNVATLSASPGTTGSTGGRASVVGIWTSTGPDLDFNTSFSGLHRLPSGYDGIWAFTDDPSEGLATTQAILNPPISNALNETRYCRQFQFSLDYYTSDPFGKQGIAFTITPYADVPGTMPLTPGQKIFTPSHTGQVPNQFWTDIITFPNLGSEIRSFRISISGAPTNVRDQGVSWTNVSVVPIGNLFALSAASPGLTLGNGYGGLGSGPATNGHFGGAILTKDYGSAQDWSQAGVISLSLSATGGLSLSELIADGLQLLVGLRQYNSGSPNQPHYYTNPLSFSTADSSAYVDITTIPGNILSSFQYFEILFLSDVTSVSPFSPVFTITSIDAGGNLAQSTIAGGITTAPYYYIVTEISDADNATFAPQLVNIIESDPGPVSNQISPSGTKDIGKVVLPAPVNTDSAHWMAVYRAGGITASAIGAALLVATVPVGADIALGGDVLNRDNLNPYISWDHTTRTLTDNTPDSFLFNAELLQYGREQLPHGAQAICAWQNRIWLGVGSTLYGSWNVVADAEAGAYTTTIDSATDPSASIKGITLGVGAADNDTIVAMVPIGSYLFILKNYSVWILSGYDPTDFSLQQFLQYAGSGSVAPRAAVPTGSDGPAYTPLGLSFNHVNFLGSDGLYSFDGSTSKPASVPLLTVLNVKDKQGNVLIPASVYSKIAMMFHNHRLLIFAPEVFYYGDLAIDATDTSKVTSVSRPFTSADVGASLNFTGGSGFAISGSPLTVASVTGGAAVLSASAGTAGSTGGMANFAAARNSVTWVFDTYVGGFTRYLIGGTSGCSLSAGSDTNDAIICDYTGQIFLLSGTGDKATPSSSLSPIPIKIVTGGFGQGFGEQQAGDPGYYAKSRPTRLWVDVISPGPPPTYTFTVTGTNPRKAFSTTYTPAEGPDTFMRKVSPSAEGPSVTVGVSASSVGRIRLRALGLDFSKGTITG